MTLEQIINAHELDKKTDDAFAADAAAHPEACSCDADYPGWTPAMGCCPAPVSLAKRSR